MENVKPIEERERKKLEHQLKISHPRIERETSYTKIAYDERKALYRTWSSGSVFELDWYRNGNLHRIAEIRLFDFIGEYLEHVVYKALKRAFGDPDIPFVEIDDFEHSPTPEQIHRGRKIGWRYLLAGPENSSFEITRLRYEPEVTLKVWSKYEIMPERVQNAINEEIGILVSRLKTLFDFEASRYSIKNEIRKSGEHIEIYVNLFRQYYSAGLQMLETADREEEELEKARQAFFIKGEWNESLRLYMKRGTYYLSGMIFFWMALEGFINTLYKLLVLPQYDHEMYRRLTVTAHIDLRILTLPAFCKGFSSGSIDPESDLFKNLKKVIDFRNDLFHVNITEEHTGKDLVDEGHVFTYRPLYDRSRKVKSKYHTYKQFYSKEDALELAELVDGVVKGILNGMDDEQKRWVGGWLDKEIIDVPSWQKKSK